MWLTHPLTGAGLGSFRANQKSFLLSGYFAAIAPTSHSLFVGILSEMGVLGAAVFAVMICIYLKKAFELYKWKPQDVYTAGWLLFLVGNLGQELVDNQVSMSRYPVMFCLVLAMISVTHKLAAGKYSPNSIPPVKVKADFHVKPFGVTPGAEVQGRSPAIPAK